MTAFVASYKSEGFLPDQLIAGNPQLLYSIPIVVLSGQVLKRGALLGKITASSKYVLSLAASSDGSQTPSGVLVDDVDATTGDKPGLLYIRGDFIDKSIILGAGHTLTSVAAALRDMGIFLVNGGV